jgi:hypothetical protein
MPTSSSERKEETAVASAPPSGGDVAASAGQIKCLMFGVGTIVFMNLVLTVVAVILGLQVKSEVEGLEEELAPLMEFAATLEGATGGGGGGGGLPTP